MLAGSARSTPPAQVRGPGSACCCAFWAHAVAVVSHRERCCTGPAAAHDDWQLAQLLLRMADGCLLLLLHGHGCSGAAEHCRAAPLCSSQHCMDLNSPTATCCLAETLAACTRKPRTAARESYRLLSKCLATYEVGGLCSRKDRVKARMSAGRDPGTQVTCKHARSKVGWCACLHDAAPTLAGRQALTQASIPFCATLLLQGAPAAELPSAVPAAVQVGAP